MKKVQARVVQPKLPKVREFGDRSKAARKAKEQAKDGPPRRAGPPKDVRLVNAAAEYEFDYGGDMEALEAVPEAGGQAAGTLGHLEAADADIDSPRGADGFDSDEERDPLPYDSPTVATAFFCHMTAAYGVLETQLATARTAYQTSVDEASSSTPCPKCGQQGDCTGMTPVPVVVVTWEQPVRITVPRIICSSCKQAYMIQPTAINCLPDTRVSWDLLAGYDGISILWWPSTLLQMYTCLQFFNRHLGMERFCAAMLDTWSENSGKQHGVSLAQLRQRLSMAAQRYRYLRGLVEDYPECLPGWPAGALNACACCGDAESHIGASSGAGGGLGDGSSSGGAQTGAGGTGGGLGDGSGSGGAQTGAGGAGGGLGDGSGSGGAQTGAGGAGGGLGDGSGSGGAQTGAGGVRGDGSSSGGGQTGAGSAGGGLGDGSSSGGGQTGAGSAGGGLGSGAGGSVLLRPLLAGGAEPAGPGPSSLHSGQFDCVFKLDLFSRRGPPHKYSRNYKQLSRRRYIISNTFVRGFEQSSSETVQPDMGRGVDCSNFTADKVLAKEAPGKLVTAAGVAVCRHGMLLRLVNLFHGERHMYSTAAAASILAAGTAVQFWWYDIACRWSKSWHKWCQSLDCSAAYLGIAAAMVSLVPPFHSYAHSYQCQKAFGHLGHKGAGRGTGDVCEIFNSQVGPQGKVLRYTSPLHRESVLEDVGRRYCRQVELGLPARIYRMRLRAQAAHDAAQARIQSLEQALGPDQVRAAKDTHMAQCAQTVHAAARKRRAEADVVTSPDGWKAIYARCRLSLMKLQRFDTLDNPADPVPVRVLIDGGEDLTLRQRPALVKQLEKQRAELEAEHAATIPPPRSWAADSPDFKGAVSELAEGEIQKLSGEIEGLVLDFNSLKLIADKLHGRKKEQDYAIKEKKRAYAQLRKLWEHLEAWCRVDTGGRQGIAEKERNSTIISGGLQGVLKEGAVFPWACGPEGAGGRAVASLIRAYNQEARAREELELIKEEITRACAYYGRRVAVLNAAMATCPAAEQLLFAKHHRRCEAVKAAFQALEDPCGEAPDDNELETE